MKLPKKFNHLVSITDLSKDDFEEIFKVADRLAKMNIDKKSAILKNKTVALLFFEPSTRTKLSFETAAKHLGAVTVGFGSLEGTSLAKGESLIDTIKVVERYADVIVMRHPHMGSARLASQISQKPIINAGDGANQHPTQTLLDLYTIRETFGKIDGLKIAIVGDLKYGRTVHSLAYALIHYKVELIFISPPSLRLPANILKNVRSRIYAAEDELLFPWLDKVDIVYMTRIQKERFSDPLEYEKVKNSYRLTADMLSGKPVKIMHPLPRISEIDPAIDSLPNAIYFDQAELGVVVREAILALLKP